mmetsp:Transcript_17823/g.42843  ORF Transcript_17823/g.42843 Transcript_17823/m.42843 type:complete len:267 (+) Transcript_17823:4484-5284(+)
MVWVMVLPSRPSSCSTSTGATPRRRSGPLTSAGRRARMRRRAASSPGCSPPASSSAAPRKTPRAASPLSTSSALPASRSATSSARPTRPADRPPSSRPHALSSRRTPSRNDTRRCSLSPWSLTCPAPHRAHRGNRTLTATRGCARTVVWLATGVRRDTTVAATVVAATRCIWSGSAGTRQSTSAWTRADTSRLSEMRMRTQRSCSCSARMRRRRAVCCPAAPGMTGNTTSEPKTTPQAVRVRRAGRGLTARHGSTPTGAATAATLS